MSPDLPVQLGVLAAGRTKPYQPLWLLSHPRADSICSSQATKCGTQDKDMCPLVLGKGGGSTFLPPVGLKDHYEHNIFLWGEEDFWGCPCSEAALSDVLNPLLTSEQHFKSSLTRVGIWLG